MALSRALTIQGHSIAEYLSVTRHALNQVLETQTQRLWQIQSHLGFLRSLEGCYWSWRTTKSCMSMVINLRGLGKLCPVRGIESRHCSSLDMNCSWKIAQTREEEAFNGLHPSSHTFGGLPDSWYWGPVVGFILQQVPLFRRYGRYQYKLLSSRCLEMMSAACLSEGVWTGTPSESHLRQGSQNKKRFHSSLSQWTSELTGVTHKSTDDFYSWVVEKPSW